MFEIKLDPASEARTRAQLQELINKSKNLKPVLAEIGEEMLEVVKTRFATSTGPDGQAWAANQESTLSKMLKSTKGNYKKSGDLSAKGAKRLAGKKPLVLRGTLASTISYKATADSLKIGSGLIYSRVQQQGAGKGAFGRTKRGGPIPWGNIPARPYLGFSDDDAEKIMDILKRYLEP